MAEKKVSGAALGESWFLVYFYIASKYPTFKIGRDQISAEYWVNYFESGKTLEDFLKKAKLTKLIKILGDDLKAIDNRNRFTVTDAEKYFTKGSNFVSSVTGKKVPKGGGWDEALKFQATRFLRNGAVRGAAQMNVLRQGQFYSLTGLDVVLSDLFKFYNLRGTLDRWNPADVWFYKPTAVTRIKKYLKDTKGLYDRSERGKNKSIGIEAINGLNSLLLELYDDKSLYPVSLKKASFNKYKGRDEKNSKFGSYTFRLAAINDPRKDVKGRPNDPKLVNKRVPIKPQGTKYIAGGGEDVGAPKLTYIMELDTIVYNQNGEKTYVREFNYLTYEDLKQNLSAKPQKRYKEAQSGSLGIENINEISFTADVAAKIRTIRNKIEGMKHRNIVDGQGSAQVGIIQKEKTDAAMKYFDLLCKNIDTTLKNKTYQLAATEANRNSISRDAKRLKSIQTELEILYAIEKSKDPVEMVFDLWKAAVAKGQTGRKGAFDKIVQGLQEAKGISKEEAQKEAEKLMRAKTPPVIKIPSSFHLKLY